MAYRREIRETACAQSKRYRGGGCESVGVGCGGCTSQERTKSTFSFRTPGVTHGLVSMDEKRENRRVRRTNRARRQERPRRAGNSRVQVGEWELILWKSEANGKWAWASGTSTEGSQRNALLHTRRALSRNDSCVIGLAFGQVLRSGLGKPSDGFGLKPAEPWLNTLQQFRRENELEQFVRIVGETKPTKRDFLFLFTGGVLQLLES
ncbi:hypothetical protein B0H13DRAFT_2424070 [Mycena leptocephala]|nr:hypothetical protein B0H13DRAFT_2424070 [Mycena leptocephala]